MDTLTNPNPTLNLTDLSSAIPAAPGLHLATLPLHIATLCYTLLHFATLCYTPATPQPLLLSPLNLDELMTCAIPDSAQCYTCEIKTPPANSAADLNLGPINSYDHNASSATPATCSIDHPLLQLSPIQHRALDLLHAGQSVAATARVLNIHRVTVQRWKTHHPRFIAELAHRAALSHVDTSLKAHRALDVAMNIILKSLASDATDSSDARQTALRLIASPRLARLAATSTSVSLRQTLSQFQQLRAVDAPSDAPADPQLLSDLAAELDAPIATDSPQAPKPSKAPRHMAERPTRTPPWAPPPKPHLKEVLANHPIRPDLLAAFKQYGCTPEQVDIAARRPDIAPFDIHYFAASVNHSPLTPKLLGDCYGDKQSPSGVECPLNPSLIAEMIAAGLIKHLAGHDLSGYTAAADPDTKALTLTHPTKPAITIPHAHLWRDAIMAPLSRAGAA